ncbi:MAG: ABC transporter substrate-binding protein [Gammaproteobacteria bacterium]|nr:ABC transporter substrate-binding protein [Gammaproteobacteria bacterium]
MNLSTNLLQKPFRLIVASLLLFSVITTPVQASEPEPLTLIKSIVDNILTSLKNERDAVVGDPQLLYTITNTHLVPHVDIETMSRLVLAQQWRKATEAQREEFSRQFITLLQRFYVNALMEDPSNIDGILKIADKLMRYQPLNLNDDERKTTVRAEVTLPSGMVVPVGFSLLRNKEGVWKIYDVIVEGGSLIVNYRASFASEIKRDGLDAVLKRLEDKNNELLKQGTTATPLR